MNIANLGKDEIIKRHLFKCRHGHTGLEHRNCYLSNNEEKKTCFLDLECSGLKADFATILSYCVKEEDGAILGRALTKEEIVNGVYDRELIKECIADLMRYNRVVGYYSSKFDLPFLRTRALFHKIHFPTYGELLHTDAYLIVKHKMNLHSRRLGVVAPFLGIPAKEHPLNPTVWLRCMSGDKASLDFVLTHNKEDVISLELLWKKINQFTRICKTSI
jgi:uncharacterized protein YprB with RNaseH-like and TPR domain